MSSSPTARQREVYETVQRHDGNQTAAARELRIDRSTVSYLVQQFTARTNELSLPCAPKARRVAKPPATGTVHHLCTNCGSEVMRPPASAGRWPSRCDDCRALVGQRPLHGTRHVVAAVRFGGHPGPSGTAPIECACGWVGVVDDWQAHRREMGLSTTHLSDLRNGEHEWRDENGRTRWVAR